MVADVMPRLLGGALLATGEWGLGEYIADVWGPEYYVPLVLGLASGGAIIGLVATPRIAMRGARRISEQMRTIPTSRLLSGLVGLVLGLVIALLISIPVARTPGWAGTAVPIALSIFLAYVGGLVMFAPRRDVFRKLLDDPEHPSTNGVAKDTNSQVNVLLDTSAIIDGRIAGISSAGFLQGTLMIPKFVLDELRHVADSSDSMRRNRGRRGLEMLNQLRQEGRVRTEVIDSDYRNGMEIDRKLVELAKTLHASILTTDYNLNRVAQIEGVNVLNVNELANSVRPAVLPGEGMTLKIIQEGKEPGQGVGFLDDGTMVVVESGIEFLDRDADVTITRVLQTVAGCMIFAQPRRSQ